MTAGKSQSGFTLIELLVVIAIIGILSATVLASLNDARAAARDAARRSDLNTIRTAMELYYSKHGTYLVSGGGYNGNGQGWFNHGSGSYPNSVANVLIAEGALSAEPIDPLQGSTGYMIYLCPGGRGYTLYATLENPSPQDQAAMLNGCGNPAYYQSQYGKNYGVGIY